MAIICRILQCRQNLLRLAKPIIHTHLLTHFFSLFEVFNGLFFLACVRVKLTQIHETSGILWLVSQGLEQFLSLGESVPAPLQISFCERHGCQAYTVDR